MSLTYQTITADPLDEKDRQKIAAYIERSAGIQMPATKKTLIESRLRKRQRALKFTTLKSYVEFVFGSIEGEAELIHLTDALTTNKTDFYRESPHFEFLRTALPAIALNKDDCCHVWSAGCSSGEEPYTLGIELSEHQREFSDFNFKVHATDISNTCLSTAKRAIYSHERIQPMDMVLRRRYLLRSRNKEDGKIKIAPEVTKCVDFKFFNLISGDWSQYKAMFSVIFCRNVMIYFNNQDRATLTRRFCDALLPGGLLFIGHSESLIDPDKKFTRLRPTVYRKLR